MHESDIPALQPISINRHPQHLHQDPMALLLLLPKIPPLPQPPGQTPRPIHPLKIITVPKTKHPIAKHSPDSPLAQYPGQKMQENKWFKY